MASGTQLWAVFKENSEISTMRPPNLTRQTVFNQEEFHRNKTEGSAGQAGAHAFAPCLVRQTSTITAHGLRNGLYVTAPIPKDEHKRAPSSSILSSCEYFPNLTYSYQNSGVTGHAITIKIEKKTGRNKKYSEEG